MRSEACASAEAGAERTSEKADLGGSARRCDDCAGALEGPAHALGEAGLCNAPLCPARCARCRFQAMDPFRPVLEHNDILHWSALPKTLLKFNLELPELKQWRKDGIEVELRMLKAWRSRRDRDVLHQAWPKVLYVSCNGREVFAAKPGPRGHTRRDVPYALSAHLRRGTNEVKLRAVDENAGDFFFAVVAALPRGPRALAPATARLAAEECRSRVCSLVLAPRKEALAAAAASAEAEVGAGAEARSGAAPEDAASAPTALPLAPAARRRADVECVGDERLSLRCPITLQRLASPPARGRECKHLQCFDLEAYLVSNYRMRAFNSRWRCPLCSLELRPSDLVIDAFVEEVLEATAADGVLEVFVSTLGSWRAGERESGGDASGGSAGEPVGDSGKAAACLVEDVAGEEAAVAAASRAEAPSRGRSAKGRRPLHAGVADTLRRLGRRGAAGAAGAAQSGSASRHPAGKKRLSSNRRRRGASPADDAAATKGAMAKTHKVKEKGRQPPREPAKPKQAPRPAPRPAPPRLVHSWRAIHALRLAVPLPKHAIDLDSDAGPEVVSDSGSEKAGGGN